MNDPWANDLPSYRRGAPTGFQPALWQIVRLPTDRHTFATAALTVSHRVQPGASFAEQFLAELAHRCATATPDERPDEILQRRIQRKVTVQAVDALHNFHKDVRPDLRTL